MFTLIQLQELILKRINSLNFNKEPKGLYEPIEYSLASGGKRIRPVLVLAACNLFSEDIEAALPAASAFEIFHNFTLLHDDIMDNSPIRRNRQTVHKKWNANTAILSGDAMMIESYKLLSELPDNVLKPVFKLFNRTALEVCEGQQYDMDFETRDYVSEKDYLTMIKLKTSVLIAASLKAGAIIGGADKKNADLLYDFGLNIGLAFQIQDDLLDTYADVSVFGKQPGNDILTGKKTFLLIRAFKEADEETKIKLSSLISDKKIDNSIKINSVKTIYDRLKIPELTEIEIKKYFQKAVSSLNMSDVETEKKVILSDFADKLMCRKK